METAKVDETIISPQADRIRTNTGDSSTEVGQDGGLSVTHLTLDRELSLDAMLIPIVITPLRYSGIKLSTVIAVSPYPHNAIFENLAYRIANLECIGR